METKEIEQILSEIGITEETCQYTEETLFGYTDTYHGPFTYNYYWAVLESIEKFMNHLENQQDNGKTDEFGNYFITKD